MAIIEIKQDHKKGIFDFLHKKTDVSIQGCVFLVLTENESKVLVKALEHLLKIKEIAE